ncbi:MULTISPECIES: tRNA pseudouridine(38-40) synthase TruA [Auritidibacter]|uniref:tRNA pseudouridine(38-40) synthase TruA n=1 Tax=Auritidibacter TaxID=1160973 RepID=UPI000D726E81|nr:MULTISPECIES: tRNA pseudouridine(38-40) synthase TruA [Auritidibacter]AXR73029.1 tRNA pseudouridine(38-40) synthase TruA [Auritidibacter sp. NML130574]PXA80924.1 tRNA pseudouridine(38-40) synthase TruA [Auritidibacter sp. NML120636]RMX22885.1 tRNA pseudouridine(38-40) synthase TruA [Auritidibacter ignavus]WGH81568.1 tRNA pseudouridine(38-40) synthase TruA [Auritidibacter ignavus]WGH86177.1 tRNA pseudouridine(38-40) synthase TruA [Auritidibacter ignavus]
MDDEKAPPGAQNVFVQPRPANKSARTSRSVRVKVRCGYDGGAFHGWARQPGLTTVQGEIEQGLHTLIRREIRTVVAGRTDAGVHAEAQVFQFDLTQDEWWGLARGKSALDPGESLVRRLNGTLKHLGGAIHIYTAERAPEGFDARFSPTQRRYRYRIADRVENFRPLERHFTCWLRRELNVSLMQAEANTVLGLHDFLSFCKPKPDATTIRTVHDIRITRDDSGIITAELVADAFCHNMVRALMGALIQVGEGSKDPGWLAHRLAAKVRDSQVRLAPAEGLILSGVDYPNDEDLASRAEQTRAKRDTER